MPPVFQAQRRIMELKSKRLLFREWRETDAETLYRLARVPEIGDGAGFPPHKSQEDSLFVIRNVLNEPETYAVVNRKTGEIIGSAGLHFSLENNTAMRAREAEIGYWIAKPLWGWGFATEAAETLVRHAKEDLHLVGVWGSVFPSNCASRRVLEKAGLTFHHAQSILLRQLAREREVLYFYRPLETPPTEER